MKKHTVFIGILLISLIFLQACGNNKVIHQMVDSSEEMIVGQLEDIIDDSEVIVKGHFGKYIDKENMIRESSNPEIPAEDIYIEGHIYEFHIEEVYKGDVDNLINVIIPYASEIRVYNEIGRHVGNVMNEDTEYQKPDPEQSNILFLSDSQIRDKDKLYSPGSTPYNLAIEKDESIQFVSKRIEGQLENNVIMEDRSSRSAYIVHKHRDDVYVDVTEEFSLIPDVLKGKTLGDVEELLSNIKQ